MRGIRGGGGSGKLHKCFSTPMLRLIRIMESTCHSLSEVTCSSEESTARTRVARGKSLKACAAKAVGWTLEKSKDVPMQDDHINKMS